MVLGLLATLAVVCLLYFWLKPSNTLAIRISAPPARSGQNGQSEVEPQARQITYNHVENGIHKWGLVAENGNYDMKTDTIYLNTISIIFYPEEGGELHLEADSGQYDQTRQWVLLEGHVRGRDAEGRVMTTDRLTYTDAEKLMDTDSPVVITGQDFTINSLGMQFYLPTRQILFKQRVDSVFIPQ
jgi:LPS export ABC transporter protein LptC